MLSAGKRFPKFSLPNQDGKIVRLEDFAGHWLVVYFYPKDDTPLCTLESKSFTANKTGFDRLGVNVVGISGDDVASHKIFCNRFALTIDLLADIDTSLMRAAGIGKTQWNGRRVWERTTFVVDPDGIIRGVYKNVNPEGHAKFVLEDVKELKAKAA